MKERKAPIRRVLCQIWHLKLQVPYEAQSRYALQRKDFRIIEDKRKSDASRRKQSGFPHQQFKGINHHKHRVKDLEIKKLI